MRSRHLCLFLWWLSPGATACRLSLAVAAMLLAGVPARAAKVAVIDLTHSPDTEAVLTAALAKTDGLEVLERDQMAKLVDEKQLNDLETTGKFSALGKLLGADGLIVLDKISLPNQTVQISGNITVPAVDTTSSQLTARLIGVTTGACLFVQEMPKSASDFKDAAEWIAHLVAEKANLLAAHAEGVIPISVLDLRSDYPALDAQKMETALKRLLDVQLSDMPGFLLLERRALGNVNFEKSLNATDAASLLGSAMQVEGVLSTWQPNGNFAVKLWLRHNDGTQTDSVEFTGQKSDLTSMAAQMGEAVRRLAGLPASAAPASKLQEPALFVREAIWAWKAKDNAAATEALDAALALGDKSADADLLESKLAYEKFGALPQTHQVTISTVRNGQRVSVTELRQAPLRDRAIDNALLTEALISYLAFVQAGGTSSGNFNVHAPMVQIPFGGSFPDALVVDATEFLAQRDEQGESGWDDLRELGRQMLELPGTDLLIKLYVLSAPTLARDPDQLVSWYERALFYPKLSNLGPGDRNLEVKGFPGIYFPLTPDSALGPRFRNDLVAVQKWRTLLDRGLADPQYRARTLLVLAADGSTPEQLTYYQQYLQELAQHAGLLRQSGELDTLLQMDKYTARLKPTDPAEDEQLQRARVSLIISLLNSLSNSYPPASNLIAATKIPNDSLTDFQRAYVGYRGRCLSAEADQEKRQTIEDSFRSLEQALRQSYPDLVLPELSHPSPQTTALFTINHLWSPSLAGITMPPNLSLLSWSVNGDTVWLNFPARNASVPANSGHLLEVSLPDLVAHDHAIAGPWSTFATTTTALWLAGTTGIGTPDAHTVIIRHDLATGTDTQWELARQSYLHLSAVGERVFLYFASSAQSQSGGLFEINSDSGQLTLLISTQRRPAESPFDEKVPFAAPSLFAGPDGEVMLKVGTGASTAPSGIYEVGGEWKQVFAGYGDIVHVNDTFIFGGAEKGLLLVQPGVAPAILLTPQADGSVKMINDWKWPEIWKYDSHLIASLVYYNGELLYLEPAPRPAPSATTPSAPSFSNTSATPVFLRWWFKDGPPEGLRLTLQFALSHEDAATLQSRGQRGPVTFNSHSPTAFVSAPSGLLFAATGSGFWFIPYTDLDAYRQAYLASADGKAATAITVPAPVQTP